MNAVQRFEQLIASECRSSSDEAFARESLAAVPEPRFATVHLYVGAPLGRQVQVRAFADEPSMLATVRMLPAHCAPLKRMDLTTGMWV